MEEININKIESEERRKKRKMKKADKQRKEIKRREERETWITTSISSEALTDQLTKYL